MLAVPAATGLVAAPPVGACGHGGEKGRGSVVVVAPLGEVWIETPTARRMSLFKAHSSPQPALFEEKRASSRRGETPEFCLPVKCRFSRSVMPYTLSLSSPISPHRPPPTPLLLETQNETARRGRDPSELSNPWMTSAPPLSTPRAVCSASRRPRQTQATHPQQQQQQGTGRRGSEP